MYVGRLLTRAVPLRGAFADGTATPKPKWEELPAPAYQPA